MGNRITLGATVLVGSNLIRICVQLAVLPLLSRILQPQDFGVVALAMPVILVINLVLDSALNTPLVRRGGLPKAESTAFWIGLALGTTFAVSLAAIAGPLAAGLRQPAVEPIFIGLAGIIVIGALCIVPSARLQRTERFFVFAISDVACVLTSAVAAILAALNGWGAWSLVAQQLTLWTTKLVCTGVGAGFFPRLEFSRQEMRALLQFGVTITVSSVAMMVSRSIDNVLVGARFGAAALGLYAMAFQIVTLTETVLGVPIKSAMLPAVARMSHEGQPVGALFAAVMRQVTILVAPLVFGLAAVAEPAIVFALGETWRPAAPVLLFLAPAGLAFAWIQVSTGVLLGLGRGGTVLKISIAVAASSVLGVVVGSMFSPIFVAIGYTVGIFALMPVLLTLSAHGAGGKRRDLLREVAGPIAGALAAAGAVRAAQGLLPAYPSWQQLLICIPLGAAIYLAALFLIDGRRLREDFRRMRALLPGRAPSGSAEEAPR